MAYRHDKFKRKNNQKQKKRERTGKHSYDENTTTNQLRTKKNYVEDILICAKSKKVYALHNKNGATCDKGFRETGEICKYNIENFHRFL